MPAQEKSILFNSEMVRAILDDRKTQTRRIITLQPTRGFDTVTREGEYWVFHSDNDNHYHIKAKYQVGDTLWVRENVRTLVCQRNNKTWEYGEFEIEYIADRTIIMCPDEHEEWWRHNWHKRPATTIPSIHMPKWLTRIFLEITDIRVERNNKDIWEWIINFKKCQKKD